MPFVKGQSGNPKGRPRETTEVRRVKLYAEKHSMDAIKALVKMLDSENETVRMKAADTILDRGIGKAAQQLIHSGDEDAPVQMKTQILISSLDDESDSGD